MEEVCKVMKFSCVERRNGERDEKEKWSEMKGERDLEREKESKNRKEEKWKNKVKGKTRDGRDGRKFISWRWCH